MNTGNKRKLFASATMVVASLALLAGLTFAWFTDSVKSEGNQIQTGTLGITLNGNDSSAPILKSTAQWEPGYSEKVTATVANTGSLWLKYGLAVENVKGGDNDAANLAEVLDVYASNSEITDLSGLKPIGTVADLAKDAATLGGESVLAPAGYSGADGQSSKSLYLVVKMKESAGNQYQGTSITFDVVVKATQTAKETDGFGNSNYDAKADYEGIITASTPDEFKAALGSVKEGQTVVLGESMTIEHTGKHEDGTYDTYITAQNATIDLNGKTLTVKNNGYVFSLTASDITLKNGTIKIADATKTAYPLYVTSGAKDVVIDGVTIEGGMQVNGNSSATLRNVTITASTYYDMYLEYKSTVTIESGTFSKAGNKPHVWTAQNTDKVIVKGGSFDGQKVPEHGGKGTVDTSAVA